MHARKSLAVGFIESYFHVLFSLTLHLNNPSPFRKWDLYLSFRQVKTLPHVGRERYVEREQIVGPFALHLLIFSAH